METGYRALLMAGSMIGVALPALAQPTNLVASNLPLRPRRPRRSLPQLPSPLSPRRCCRGTGNRRDGNITGCPRRRIIGLCSPPSFLGITNIALAPGSGWQDNTSRPRINREARYSQLHRLQRPGQPYSVT